MRLKFVRSRSRYDWFEEANFELPLDVCHINAVEIMKWFRQWVFK